MLLLWDNWKHAVTPKPRGRLYFWVAIVNICSSYLYKIFTSLSKVNIFLLKTDLLFISKILIFEVES